MLKISAISHISYTFGMFRAVNVVHPPPLPVLFCLLLCGSFVKILLASPIGIHLGPSMDHRGRRWPGLLLLDPRRMADVNGRRSVGRNFGCIVAERDRIAIASRLALLGSCWFLACLAAIVIVGLDHFGGQFETIGEAHGRIFPLWSGCQGGRRLLLGQQANPIVGIRVAHKVGVKLFFATAIAAAAGTAAAQAATPPTGGANTSSSATCHTQSRHGGDQR